MLNAVTVDWSRPTHFKHGVSAQATSNLKQALNCFVTSFAYHVGSTKLSGQRDAVAMMPRMMICSAPSRFAAITPHKPTAPS